MSKPFHIHSMASNHSMFAPVSSVGLLGEYHPMHRAILHEALVYMPEFYRPFALHCVNKFFLVRRI
jgi:hypothetical protein